MAINGVGYSTGEPCTNHDIPLQTMDFAQLSSSLNPKPNHLSQPLEHGEKIDTTIKIYIFMLDVAQNISIGNSQGSISLNLVVLQLKVA